MRTTFIAFMGSLAFAAHAVADPQRIEIPAGDLASALASLARQAQVDLVYSEAQVKGRKTAGVVGGLSAQDAIAKLLEGTALEVRRDEASGALLIAPPILSPSTAPAASRGRGASNSEPVVSDRETDEAGQRRSFWERFRMAQADSSTTASEGSSQQPNSFEGNQLAEVVVTARKVSERLQDVPISVTAISGAELEQIGAVDIKDVLRSVPGLAYAGQDRSKSVYTIRGVASGLTTTGIYLDDISLLNTGLEGGGGGADPVFFDMARVEVLKGPQGTLYGGSAMGGAIKYVSARPDLSRFSGSGAVGTAVTAQGGAPSYNAEAVLNLPIITDVLAIRGGLYFSQEAGYIDNLPNLDIENPARSSTPFPVYTPVVDPSFGRATDKDYNSADTRAARLSLLWQPDSSFSIRPALYYQDYRLDNPSEFLPNEGGLVSSYRFTNQEQRDRFALYSLEVNKGWAGVELTSLTGYFDRKFVGDRDYSYFVNRIIGLPFETDSFAHYANTTKTFSQELRLSSTADSDGRLTWVTGLYYSQRKIHATPQVQVFSALLPPGLLLDGNRRRDIEDYAAFGEASYQLIGGLELTAGIRLFKNEQTSVERDQGLAGNAPSDLESSEDGINPKLGLSYKLALDHLIYTSAAKGFREGGPLPLSFTATCAPDFPALGFLNGPPSSFESDSLWTYELGSKNSFGGNRIVLNSAIFQTNWKEIQQTVSLPTCGQPLTVNAGEARIRGAELETDFRITSAFQIGGTASYLDAEITEAGAISTFSEGDDLQFAPKWMTSVRSVYSVPLASEWELRIRADYQYRSDSRLQYASVQRVVYSDDVVGFVPNAAQRNPSYEIANVSFAFENDHTSVRLFVNNVLDERPVLDYDPTGLLHSRASTLRPRTIGIEFRQNF